MDAWGVMVLLCGYVRTGVISRADVQVAKDH
jgi:hypothetical protein